MMASLGNFETLDFGKRSEKSERSQSHNLGDAQFWELVPKPAFSIYLPSYYPNKVYAG